MDTPSSTIIISLLSGIIGAAVTAAFNYMIQTKVEKEKQLKKERDIAYSYIIELSEYNIIKKIITEFSNLINVIFPDLEENNLDKIHIFSIIIEDIIKKDSPNKNNDIIYIYETLEGSANKLSRKSLTYEQKSQLPRDIQIHYFNYEQQLEIVESKLIMFRTIFSEKTNIDSLSPQDIMQAIEAINSLMDFAETLTRELMKYGRISEHERLQVYANHYRKIKIPNIFDQEPESDKLKFAREILNKKKK